MWCLKCFRKSQDRDVLPRSIHNQIFQDGEFFVDCHDKLLQILNREDKAEVADAMTLLESKQYPLFIFCSDAIITGIINSEREVR
jgi:hypothetical protein